jgi:ABC-type transport system involved in multi-copper enzyme maturation permease subunit
VSGTGRLAAIGHVFRAEAFKVLRKRRVYVLAALYWVVLPVLALVTARVLHVNLARSFANEVGNVDQALQLFASPFGLVQVALAAPAYMSPTLYIVAVALVAALLIGDERSQNMWKSVLVVQPDRWAVLIGKVAVAMATLGALMLGGAVSGFLFGAVGTTFLPTTFVGAWSEVVGLYLLQWAVLLAPTLFAFLMVFVVRSGVLGVVTVLFLPGLVEGIYTVLTSLAQLQPLNRINAVFQALRLRRAWESLPEYFFTANLYLPARWPVRDAVNALIESDGDVDMGPLTGMLGGDLTLPHAGLVMLGYAAAFGLLLTWAFLRRDVD